METTPSFPRPAEAEATPSVRIRNFLRVILVLSFTGLFVAGALSVSKLFGLGLPCGAAHGCDRVNSHPSAYWFGVPVAYVGFLGYALLAALAAARAGMGAERARPLALAGYLVAGFGAMTSVALQIYSFTVIQATCRWCLASAAIMIALLVFHALEYGDRVSEDVPAGTGEFKLVTGLGALAAVALAAYGFTAKKASYQAPIVVSQELLKKAPLVPDTAHIFGDKDSPITIVEFADLMCPSCQRDSPKVKEFVAKHPGKVRLVYRSFPLDMHPMGTLVAGMAEAAAEDGKFWDYAVAMMATGENMQTKDRVFEATRNAGFDPDKLAKRLQDENGPATKRLNADINAANALGISMTPTFLVQVKGMETEAYGFPTLMDELEKGRYKKLVEGP